MLLILTHYEMEYTLKDEIIPKMKKGSESSLLDLFHLVLVNQKIESNHIYVKAKIIAAVACENQDEERLQPCFCKADARPIKFHNLLIIKAIISNGSADNFS